jgi:hypothetical protein
MSPVTAEAIAKEICAAPEFKAIAADLIQLAFKPEIKGDALYNYNEVAMLTGVSARTIKRAVESERLKVDYIGSEPRVRGAAILQWLDEGGKTGRSRRDLIREAA